MSGTSNRQQIVNGLQSGIMPAACTKFYLSDAKRAIAWHIQIDHFLKGGLFSGLLVACHSETSNYQNELKTFDSDTSSVAQRSIVWQNLSIRSRISSKTRKSRWYIYIIKKKEKSGGLLRTAQGVGRHKCTGHKIASLYVQKVAVFMNKRFIFSKVPS